MEYTKGPWIIDRDEALIHASESSRIDYIAMLGDEINDFGNSWDDPCMTDEVRANARLIAAAPDLLEALKELVGSAEYWSEYNVPLGIVDRMKAAIAKAEGVAK